jgi:ankyrin repeat protein
LISARDKDASIGLHWAAWKGHSEIVQILIEAGSDVQAKNENYHWGTTALHAAAHGNQRAAAEVLIRNGANVNASGEGKGTPLSETRVHNATAVAKLLQEHGGVE